MTHPDYPHSFYQHRLDPPEALAAVLRFVPFVAGGLLTPEECVTATILVFPAERVDCNGYRSRLHHALSDAASDLERRRDRVAGLIRAMCWPAMDRHTQVPEILASAAAINEEHGAPLPDTAAVRAVVSGVAEQWLRRRSARNGR